MDFFGLRARCGINRDREQHSAEDFNLKPLTVPDPAFVEMVRKVVLALFLHSILKIIL